jgi:hypothetical protein
VSLQASLLESLLIPTVLMGSCWLVLGPIGAHVYFEILIVIFSINKTLIDLKNLLKYQREQDGQVSVQLEKLEHPLFSIP